MSKSVMQHSFAQVPHAEIPRSSFNRSSGYKTTFNAGQLIPFFVDEFLPGDTFNLKTSGFARMATPIFPIMDNMTMTTFYFAVPNRLVWDNWVKMMGEQDNPQDSTDFMVPQMPTPQSGYEPLQLPDYFGLPTQPVNEYRVSALPFRAYKLIYNEWFRDQNLQPSAVVDTDDGPDEPLESIFVAFRGKRHDYFTSCLPWPQKGPEIQLPLGTEAPVVTNFSDPNYRIAGGGDDTTTIQWGSGDSSINATEGPQNPEGPLQFAENTGLVTDLTNATAATINEIREAFQIQKMYERDARGGTRYIEIIKSHFGVSSPDARLQRPEYLGGGTTPINISPIHSSAETFDAQGPDTGRQLGSLSAVGTAGFQGHGFTKSFTEHGLIIGLVCVDADLTYQNGINRMWQRDDRLDYYWPALSHIGEQAVLNQEIFTDGGPKDNDVFGYQERYAEYRYKPSIITGLFRSDHPQSLDAWHLSEDFDDLPVLGEDFIRSKPPIDRVIATPDEPHFIADFYHQLNCARPMPMFGVPGNIDRF